MQPVDLGVGDRGRAAVAASRRAEAKGIVGRASRRRRRRSQCAATPSRLQQVVWNLLSNAIKFTPPGGARDVCRAERDGGRSRLSVSDTGGASRAEFLPHVFERFRQADASDTRLARRPRPGPGDRPAPRRAARRHRRAQSDGPGQGATFTVRLPAATARRIAGRAAPSRRRRPAARGCATPRPRRTARARRRRRGRRPRAARAAARARGPRCTRPARPPRRWRLLDDAPARRADQRHRHAAGDGYELIRRDLRGSDRSAAATSRPSP